VQKFQSSIADFGIHPGKTRFVIYGKLYRANFRINYV